MKKTIKIAFHPNMSPNIVDFIMTVLKRKFDVRKIRISKDYDYYFAQELIYSNRKSMLKFLDCKKDAIKILICTEDIYPDLNLCDYAIMFHQHSLWADDRVLYLPLKNTMQQEYKNDNNMEKFYHLFNAIFEQSKENAARRPEGTWPDILYPNVWLNLCEKNTLK